MPMANGYELAHRLRYSVTLGARGLPSSPCCACQMTTFKMRPCPTNDPLLDPGKHVPQRREDRNHQGSASRAVLFEEGSFWVLQPWARAWKTLNHCPLPASGPFHSLCVCRICFDQDACLSHIQSLTHVSFMRAFIHISNEELETASEHSRSKVLASGPQLLAAAQRECFASI